MLTKGAIGNLINRYKAVLTKCNLINTFGSLAVASMLVLGGAGVAEAETYTNRQTISASESKTFSALDSFTGCDSTSLGGAVMNYGSVTIDDVDFIGNHTLNQGGGAVYGYGGSVTHIVNSTFENNYIDRKSSNPSGQAIAQSGNRNSNNWDLIIENSTFKKNGYDENGAQYGHIHGTVAGVNFAQIKIMDSRFVDNYAKKGGGLFVAGTAEIHGSADDDEKRMRFEGNISTFNGGAVCLSGGHLDVYGYATFKDNFAYNSGNGIGGGAIALENNNDTITFAAGNANENTHESNVEFISNRTGKNGGAIANKGTVNFNGVSSFSENSADKLGGAIWNAGTLNFNGTNTFTNNTDSTGANDIYNEGTINILGGATLLNSGIVNAGMMNVQGGLLAIGDIDAGTVSGPTLALGSTLSLKDGAGLTVGNSNTRAGATVNFASGSKLVVDGEISGGAIVAENGGSVNVADGAKLHIENAKVGKYQVTSGFTSAVINGNGWQDSNFTITSSNVLAEANKAVVEDDNIVVNITAKEASTVLPDLIPLDNVDTMMAEGQNDTSDTAPAGIRMLSRALETTAGPEAIEAVNEVSRAAVTAGVQNTALRIADAASNTVIGHLSLSQHDGSKSIHADGADFWAAPMYGNLYTSGMVTDGASVRGQFGGLALGADLEAGQFLGGKFRLGAAINGGGGQSEAKGTATSTQNDYDFGGLNFYAGWNNGALNVIGSVGYGFGNHEVEMGLPSSMGMGTAKADVDTTVFTADLRAEYQLKTEWVDLLPHASVRYTALRTGAHDLKVGGDVLNSVERDTQNIVQFPVGVTLSKDVAFADWNVKPMVDVSVVPAAGDKKANTKVNFSGLTAVDSVNTRIMDSTSWAGTIGVQAEKGDFTLGLNYGVQTSSNETDQNVQLKLGWKF